MEPRLRNHILVVDDEPAMVRMLSRILARADFKVSEAPTGAVALKAAHTLNPDLVILDLFLPDMRGEDVLSQLIDARPNSKVLVLSAITEIATRVGVLENGAVDFLAKPFANAELVARIRTRLRDDGDPEPAVSDHPRLPHTGPQADIEKGQITADGKCIALTKRELILFCYLWHRAPAVCSRAELLKEVWGMRFDGGTNLVDVYINRLRVKLVNEKIETIRSVGYRLLSPGD